MKISEKDIGRRVVVNGEYACEVFNNDHGVLKCFGSIANQPGIAFDKPRAGFHDLNKHCKNGHGYYVPESMITFTEEETKMDMDFQVGDEVERVTYLRKGVITEIRAEKDDYPISVKWGYGDTNNYDISGKSQVCDDYPTIYHFGSIKREGSKIIIDPVKPDREKWVNVYLDSDGKPFFGPRDNQYTTKEAAKENLVSHWDYITTIQLKRSKP